MDKTKSKLHEVRLAFSAFSGRQMPDGTVDGGIGNADIPAKASHRVSRLIVKLRSELRAFEEAQRKAFLAAGAVNEGGTLMMKAPERKDDESQADFDARVEAHKQAVNKLNEEINELLEQEVEIDYQPIPLSLFEDSKLKPNDLANAGPFISE